MKHTISVASLLQSGHTKPWSARNHSLEQAWQ